MIPDSQTGVQKKSVLEESVNILKKETEEPQSGVTTKSRVQGLTSLTPKTHPGNGGKQGCLSPGGLVGKRSGTEGR